MVKSKSKSHVVYKPLLSPTKAANKSQEYLSGGESDEEENDPRGLSAVAASSRFSFSSPIENDDDRLYNEEDDDDDDDDDVEDGQSSRQMKQGYSSNRLCLSRLRETLLVVAILLFIIFIAQLTTDTQLDTKQQRAENTQHLQPAKLIAPEPTLHRYTIPKLTSSPSPTSAQAGSRPLANLYISHIELNHHILPEHSEDDLNYPNDEEFPLADGSASKQENHKLPDRKVWWKVEEKRVESNTNYVAITNYIRATKSFNYSTSITLTTQATSEFMYHSLELCKRWDGPISIAVFCPGQEITVAVSLIQFMRQCLPGPLSACIRDKITWHLVYNRAHGPPKDRVKYPKYYIDSNNFPLFASANKCPKLLGPDPSNTISQFEEQLRKRNGLHPNNYRKQFRLIYPINLLRNTARMAADTYHILASDIELYPSSNLVPMFTRFITEHNIREEYQIDKFIFTLPIFEVKPNVSAPYTKKELVSLVARGDAIFFHKYVCDWCQNFPNRVNWLTTDQAKSEDFHAKDSLVVFEITQRDKTREFWEPIFIGTNEDPLYDEQLSWEGRRDKMSQMFEMCLLDYHMLVLDNAFLVHAPGIKHIDPVDVASRVNYMRKNNAVFDRIVAKLRQKYSKSRNIDKC